MITKMLEKIDKLETRQTGKTMSTVNQCTYYRYFVRHLSCVNRGIYYHALKGTLDKFARTKVRVHKVGEWV